MVERSRHRVNGGPEGRSERPATGHGRPRPHGEGCCGRGRRAAGTDAVRGMTIADTNSTFSLRASAWPGDDFPAWLPPMLVKELRQGVQSGVFIWTFLLLQGALFLLFSVFTLARADLSLIHI